jgi:pyruvate ferredoxin oxidoreductase alpha subunit
MNSAAGTAKATIDRLREDGKKVGLLKPRLFRPFPYEEVAAALEGIKSVAVLDRSMSFGANAPLFSDVMNSVFLMKKRPELQSYVFGLGGRDLLERHVEHVFTEMLSGKAGGETKYLGLR